MLGSSSIQPAADSQAAALEDVGVDWLSTSRREEQGAESLILCGGSDLLVDGQGGDAPRALHLRSAQIPGVALVVE